MFARLLTRTQSVKPMQVAVRADGTPLKNPADQGMRRWPLVGRSKARRNAARQRVTRSARS